MSQRDKILATAKEDAKAILESASQKASTLLAESSITKLAEEEAKRVQEVAMRKAEQLLDTTKNTVDKILKAVEDYLAEHLNIVHDSRDELASTLVQLKANLKNN